MRTHFTLQRWITILLPFILILSNLGTTAPALAATTLRVEAGGSAGYTDTAGNAWAADTGFSGGATVDRGAIAIANTNDDKIYQTERYGMTGYAFTVDNGSYTVRLHFAETYTGITGAGQRVFSVNVEGVALNNIDIYAETGGRNIALIRTANVSVVDGQLNLTFTASVNNALINGIEIIPASATVLDDFEDGSLSDWTTFKDAASTMTITADSAVKYAGTYSLRMNYTIAAGGYGGAEKRFTGLNWSGATQFDFQMNGNTSNAQVRVEIADSGDERFEYRLTLNWTGWRRFSIPWSSFTKRADWQPPTATQNNVLDLGSVKGFSFAPLSGSGTLYLDQIQLLLGSSSTATPMSSTSTPTRTSTPVPPTPTRTNTPNGQPPTAPNGLYVIGNKIYKPGGVPHLLHGINRPSLEWSKTGDHLSQADYQLMRNWDANVIRLPLNQDFWLSGAAQYDSTYQGRIDQQIQWIKGLGMDVILDLHWSDKGNLGITQSAQQRMADNNSLTFWREVATKYKGDGRIMFELYNEPRDVSWSVWRNGGASGEGWTVVGMQQLYDAIRAQGANNLILIGGLNWAYDLTGIKNGYRVTGYNIAYVTHPYDYAGKQPSNWENDWGFLTATDPVAITEFGNYCATNNYNQQLLDYADQKNASWTGWAWFVSGCSFPSLISDWSGTTTGVGQLVKTRLLAYP